MVNPPDNRVGCGRRENLSKDQTSDLFAEAWKTALDLAAAASMVVDNVTDELFARVQEHWDHGQIPEIMAVVAIYCFLDHRNDAMSTRLEQPSRHAAEAPLGHAGWTPGRHA